MASDQFETHLGIIKSAGERTRGITYALFLFVGATSLLIFEYDFFDWAAERYDFVSKAYKCVAADAPFDKTVPLEKDLNDTCGRYYTYLETYYKIPVNTWRTDVMETRTDTQTTTQAAGADFLDFRRR